MRQRFLLSKTEKVQEWFLVLLVLISFIIIGFGIYYQNYNIDNNFILLPLLGAVYFIFSLLLGINGLNNGNLLPKWTPFGIFNIIAKLIAKIKNNSIENVTFFTKKLIAVYTLLIGTFLLIATFVYSANG